jgi:hypothetical protein
MAEKFSNESIKHTFSDEEKSEIAQRMAAAIATLKKTEDEFQAVKSEFKSKIDLAKSQINSDAVLLNNGYEFRNVKCIIKYDVVNRITRFYRADNGEFAKERAMYSDEYQMKIDEEA